MEKPEEASEALGTVKAYNNVKITINPSSVDPPQGFVACLRAIDEARALFTELTQDHWNRLQKCAEGPWGLLQLVESVHYDYQRTNDVEQHVQYWEQRTGRSVNGP